VALVSVNDASVPNVMDLVEDDQRQDLADAGHRAQAVEGAGVVLRGGAHDGELDLGEQRVIVVDQRQVQRDARPHARIGEALGDAGAVRLVRDLLLECGQVVLAGGVLDVGEQLGAFVHQLATAAQQVAGARIAAG
jgi:hypothetical protein